jgi:hypothetical protein
MRFANLSIGSVFVFADPAGYSIGRKFVKESPRRYREWLGVGAYADTFHKVGTVAVQIKVCIFDSIKEDEA